MPTTPPYCDGGAIVAPPADAVAPIAVSWSASACCCGDRLVARLRGALERELPRRFRRDHLCDLALDRREQPLLAAELRADARLRRSARCDEPALALVRAHERMLVGRHGLLEADDLVHHRDVLARDRLHRLDAVDEILDARRAEHDAERRLIVARRVDRDEPLHERLLRLNEIRARRVQPDLVDLQVVLDLVQLHRRHLVAAARALETCVELLDLRRDALRLGSFAADGGVAGSRAGCDEGRSNGEDEHRRLSLQNPNNGLPKLLATSAPEGPVRHKFRRLARVPDTCNRARCQKVLEFRLDTDKTYAVRDRTKSREVQRFVWYGPALVSRPRTRSAARLAGASAALVLAGVSAAGAARPGRFAPAPGAVARFARASRAARSVCARFTLACCANAPGVARARRRFELRHAQAAARAAARCDAAARSPSRSRGSATTCRCSTSRATSARSP